MTSPPQIKAPPAENQPPWLNSSGCIKTSSDSFYWLHVTKASGNLSPKWILVLQGCCLDSVLLRWSSLHQLFIFIQKPLPLISPLCVVCGGKSVCSKSEQFSRAWKLNYQTGKDLLWLIIIRIINPTITGNNNHQSLLPRQQEGTSLCLYKVSEELPWWLNNFILELCIMIIHNY